MDIYPVRRNLKQFTNAKPVITNWGFYGGLNLIRGGYRHVRMRKL